MSVRVWARDPSQVGMVHLDGVPAGATALPSRWHWRHRPQTRLAAPEGLYTWCACGALRIDSSRWSGDRFRRPLR